MLSSTRVCGCTACLKTTASINCQVASIALFFNGKLHTDPFQFRPKGPLTSFIINAESHLSWEIATLAVTQNTKANQYKKEMVCGSCMPSFMTAMLEREKLDRRFQAGDARIECLAQKFTQKLKSLFEIFFLILNSTNFHDIQFCIMEKVMII